MKKVLFLFLFGGSFLFADPIKVGMDFKYPPFEYLDDAEKIRGFDVDPANELAKR
ncbi:MAG: transporter substrate-binding domain-containing protein, partial [Campylobacter sp.]|nr:transporter substrate-binding domain-containing protein [Campylobacter sp.]